MALIKTTYRKREQHIGDYSKLLSHIQTLEVSAVKAACLSLSIPYLPTIACRLLAKRLSASEDSTRLIDSILRHPVTQIPLPDPTEGDLIVEEVVLRIAAEEGKQPDEVNIPKAIPDSFGFFEDGDPACGECPYALHCKEYTEAMQPICFKLLHSSDSIACKSCYYSPWCGSELVIEP